MKFNYVFIIFFIALISIQIFDKEDKYFFVQIIILAALLILAIIAWSKKRGSRE
ncbi:L-asparagine transporter-like permease [Chryseobacterium sp. JUb7]|nr:L-asparagine transporter-like permease [Chryseobacterium sp. JUb7]